MSDNPPLPDAPTERSATLAGQLRDELMRHAPRSRRALQAASASQTLAEQSLEAPLADLPRKTPLAVSAETPLAQALQAMHERRVGSVLVTDAGGAVQGILTRHDILGRVTLPQVALTLPIARVMTTPVHTLTVQHSLQEAALLMSRHAIRHVPVTDAGRLVNIVSERDLFALQRLSLKQVSSTIRAAVDIGALKLAAQDVRRFARNLLGQGVQARQLTELISRLNDVLTERIVGLAAQRHGLDLARACWLAFGSEGRSEQTIATDQDNGLVFDSDAPDRDRRAWLALAHDVNEVLDACGYPLCKGQVMASNPACCLSVAEWGARFEHWMAQGAPDDLLNASIFFDLRPLAGRAELAAPLVEFVAVRAAQRPRFLKQMAENVLRQRVPLNWRGAIETQSVDGREMLDVKLHGTAVFVDVARLYALAHGVAATGTRARLEGVGRAMKAPEHESRSWAAAFEFLQMLRLQAQVVGVGAQATNPNLVELATLNDIERRMLEESLRVARRLQQRVELDYRR